MTNLIMQDKTIKSLDRHGFVTLKGVFDEEHTIKIRSHQFNKICILIAEASEEISRLLEGDFDVAFSDADNRAHLVAAADGQHRAVTEDGRD